MKIFAIYFPQFYAIKENSKAWGEGFTDWDRVRSSRSQYKGHVIPRQPLNENYYAQDNEETIKWQVELATSYGIDGFDFYHYWFDGKLLLGEPVKIFAGLNVDLEYCLTWANETWTKQWSGSSETIIEQLHLNDEHLWLEHLNYLCSHFIVDIW